MKPFFRRNTLCIARENGAQQAEKDPLFGRVDGFQIDPMQAHYYYKKRSEKSTVTKFAQILHSQYENFIKNASYFPVDPNPPAFLAVSVRVWAIS